MADELRVGTWNAANLVEGALGASADRRGRDQDPKAKKRTVEDSEEGEEADPEIKPLEGSIDLLV